MAKSIDRDRVEADQEALDPHRREELDRAMRETADRLRGRGVALTGHEPGEDLVNLLEAVERFELAVESKGGDLMVDEGPHGKTREPDDIHFVLPPREPAEPATSYVARIDQAAQSLRGHRSHEG